jgi:hypothetical protein
VPRTRGSATAELWGGADEALGEYLAQTSIGQLATRQSELDTDLAPFYYI